MRLRPATSARRAHRSTFDCVLTPRRNNSFTRSGIDSRLVALRLKRPDARIERLHLKGELLVDNARDLRAGLDPVAFPDAGLRDRAADAGAGDELADGLHCRDDFAFRSRDADRSDGELAGTRAAGQNRPEPS